MKKYLKDIFPIIICLVIVGLIYWASGGSFAGGAFAVIALYFINELWLKDK